MHASNDANEGVLGSYRVDGKQALNMIPNQYDAKHHRHETGAYVGQGCLRAIRRGLDEWSRVAKAQDGYCEGELGGCS